MLQRVKSPPEWIDRPASGARCARFRAASAREMSWFRGAWGAPERELAQRQLSGGENDREARFFGAEFAGWRLAGEGDRGTDREEPSSWIVVALERKHVSDGFCIDPGSASVRTAVLPRSDEGMITRPVRAWDFYRSLVGGRIS